MPRFPTPGRPPLAPTRTAAKGADALLAEARVFHGRGMVRDAERAYRAALADRPDRLEAYLGLADLAMRAGAVDPAIALLTQATRLAPKNPQALLFLANALVAKGDADGAEATLDRMSSKGAKTPETLQLRARVARVRGDLDGAAGWLRKALKARKDDPDALLDLGACLAGLGRPEEGLPHFRKAVALRPKMPLAHCNLAQALFDLGRYGEALTACDAVLALDPNLPVALLLRPRILDALEDYGRAREAWEETVRRLPRDPIAANDAALFMMLDGLLDRSEALHRAAVSLAPGNVTFARNLCRELLNAGEGERSEAEARAWMARNGEDPEILRALADVMARDGRFAEAIPLYERAWTERPDLDGIAYALASSGKMRAGNASGDRILEAYTRAKAEGRLSSDLAYAAGKVRDDRGEWDAAFSVFAEANALQGAQAPFDIEGHEAFVEALKRVFSRSFWDTAPDVGDPDHRPVLVVGLPRSGTTLTERIIASHPRAAGAGELIHFGRLERSLSWRVDPSGATAYPDCVPRATREAMADFIATYKAELSRVGPDAERVVDKMPQNFLRLGLARLAFPNAAIVHCRRNVMDTCLSIYFQNFSRGHAYKNDLETLGRYARATLSLMDHWTESLPRPPIAVDYATLVADQEGESRRLLTALGLEWNDSVLAFHEGKGSVSTMSRWQVRQPIYRDSLARWRRYEAHLGPLLRGLGEESES